MPPCTVATFPPSLALSLLCQCSFTPPGAMPGCICTWTSDRLISKSRWKSFVCIAQEEWCCPSCNSPLRLANKPGIRQGSHCKSTLITLVDVKCCSALAALWLGGGGTRRAIIPRGCSKGKLLMEDFKGQRPLSSY